MALLLWNSERDSVKVCSPVIMLPTQKKNDKNGKMVLPTMPQSLLGLGLGLTCTTGDTGLGFGPEGGPKLCEDNKSFKPKEEK